MSSRSPLSWPSLALFVLLLAGQAAQASSPSYLDSWLYQSKRPLIVSHRGSRYLNPENTLLAFRSAQQLGADVLEMDVQLTADDRLVVFHDEDLNRTTDGLGTVRNKTLREMLSLDAGYRYTHDGGLSFPYRGGGAAGPQPLRVPAFDEFLYAFPSAWINVEIKDHELLAAELTWQHLRRQSNHSARFVVVSRFCNVIDHFRNISRGAIATAACENEATNMRIKILLGAGANTLDYYLGLTLPPAQVYQLPTIVGDFPMEGADLIDYLHSIGAKVHYWVVNDARYMRRLLIKGVDGIITDRPDIAYRVWQKMGYDMPPLGGKTGGGKGERWGHFVPLAQEEELHECVTLVCLFFSCGVGALYGLVFVVLSALLALVICLARRQCRRPSQTPNRSSTNSGSGAQKKKKKRRSTPSRKGGTGGKVKQA